MTHDHAQRTLLLIAGMSDNRAREEIAAILTAICGVIEVDVNLIRSNALVKHDPRCNAGTLSGALELAGYAVQRRDSQRNRSGDEAMCSNCTNCKKSARVAQDVMTTEPICVEPSTSIRELAQVFEVNEISGAPVVDGAGALIGVVSKTDLIRRCSEGVGDRPPAYLFEVIFDDTDSAVEVMPEQLICVGDFMSTDPATASPQTPLHAIARKMSELRIHRVIVVDDAQTPIGIVTTLDLLKAFPD